MLTARYATTLLFAAAVALTAVATLGASALAASSDDKAEQKKPTVAVLYFDYSGASEDMALLRKGLAQMLISDLAGVDGIRLVERDRLQDVMEELELSRSRKIDPKTAQRVGKLLGAKYMVLGGYFDLMGTLRVDARLVETETGKIIRSVGANGKAEDFLTIEQTVATELAAVLGSDELERFSGRTIRRTTTPRVKTATKPAEKPEDPAEPKEPKDPKTAPTPVEMPAEAPKKPARVTAATAARYGAALDALDKGDEATARKELETVVAEQPDFTLAQADLQALIR